VHRGTASFLVDGGVSVHVVQHEKGWRYAAENETVGVWHQSESKSARGEDIPKEAQWQEEYEAEREEWVEERQATW
jgi:hypothetical protein